MFLDDLRAAIADHETSSRPLLFGHSEVEECRRLLDRIEAGLLAAIHEVATDGTIEGASGLTPVEWYATACGRTHRDASSTLRLATRLARSEIVAAELASGQLTLAQAAAIVSASTERSAELFRDFEAHAIDTAKRVNTDDLTLVMRMWKRRADEITRKHDDRQTFDKREVFLSPVGDNEWALNGTLTPEAGELLKQALDAAMRQDHEGSDETRTPRQRRADALEAISRQWLEHHSTTRIHGARPQLLVTGSLDDLRRGVDGPGGVTSSGVILDGATIERLACDCLFTRVMRSSSVDVDLSAPTVEIPLAMRRAVITRDRHCRYPGCTRPGSWAEIHHVKERHEGGEHRISNLVMLCTRHHQRIHRLKLQVALDSDATFQIIDVDGTVHATRPPPDLVLPARAMPVDDPSVTAWKVVQTRAALDAVVRSVNLGAHDYTLDQRERAAIRTRLHDSYARLRSAA